MPTTVILSVMKIMKDFIDYTLEHGTSSPEFAWPGFPIPPPMQVILCSADFQITTLWYCMKYRSTMQVKWD